MLMAMLAIVLPVNGQKEGRESNGNQNNTDNLAKLSFSTIKDEETQGEKYGADDDPKSYLLRLSDPANVISIGTLIAIIVGTVVAGRTLKDIKKQTKNSETAANAALLNAQAVINSERPWIVITVIPDPEQKGLFRFRATNKGRTPANIVVAGCYCEVEFFPRGPIDGPPAEPIYKSSIIDPPENLIVSDEAFNINHGVNPESVIDSNSKRQAVTEPREWLCVYGQIAYRDVFTEPSGEPHHTRWFYSYNVDKKQMKPSGPNAYSEKK